MIPEVFDTRVLGAVRFVDSATQSQVSDGLSVESTGDLRPNRSGLWVIWNAPGLADHTTVFLAPPAAPAAGSVDLPLSVKDLSGRYLPRNATVKLPRDPADVLFEAANVTLYCSPAAPVSPGWAVIRASVKKTADDTRLESALLRVVQTTDSKVLARGLTDDRGEALVVVPGIPVTTFNTGDGAPLATEIDVTVEAIFDKDAGKVIDPEVVEAKAGLAKASSPVKLAAGRTLTLALKVPV